MKYDQLNENWEKLTKLIIPEGYCPSINSIGGDPFGEGVEFRSKTYVETWLALKEMYNANDMYNPEIKKIHDYLANIVDSMVYDANEYCFFEGDDYVPFDPHNFCFSTMDEMDYPWLALSIALMDNAAWTRKFGTEFTESDFEGFRGDVGGGIVSYLDHDVELPNKGSYTYRFVLTKSDLSNPEFFVAYCHRKKKGQDSWEPVYWF